MGIWVVEVNAFELDRAIIVDSVTERPIPLPMFRNVNEAYGYMDFAAANGFDDVRGLGPYTLNALYDRWIAAGSPVAVDEDDGDGAETEPETEGVRS